MLREKIMIKQREYIEYVSEYAEAHGKHIWLGGSFLRGNPTPYQTARLFHRSLIKYLGGKQELGVSVANEIASFFVLN